MQKEPGVKRIAPDRVTRLPLLSPPAGYVILVQDVAYGNRYKVARHQQMDRNLIRRGANFPFETRVALILEAENAAQAERELHDRLAGGAALGEWFDLRRKPTAQPTPVRRQESASLRDLAQHEGEAKSLLGDAEVVGAAAPASRPQGSPPARSTPEQPAPRRTRRHGSRGLRWASVALVVVLVAALLAEQSGDLRYFVDSIMDRSRQGPRSARVTAPAAQSRAASGRQTSPTATDEGFGAVYYVKASGRVRGCPKFDCRVIEVLTQGRKITALKYVRGQAKGGSDRWIAFAFRSQRVYLHSGELSRTMPASAPTTAPSPTAKATRVKATAEGQGEVFYVKSRANARHCARKSCATLEILPAGAKITALRYIGGQRIDGSDRWIRFAHKGQHLSIHSSKLTRVPPAAAAEPTAEASSDGMAASIVGTAYYLRIRARARVCPRLACEVTAVLPPGARVVASDYVVGETLDGNNRWVAFDHGGRKLYLHRSLLTKHAPTAEPTQRPSPTAAPARVQATKEGAGEVFFVATETHARTCASLRCNKAQELWLGMRVTALNVVGGQAIDGNDRWIRFINRGWIQYAHSSFLAREKPAVESSQDAVGEEAPAAAKGSVFRVKLPGGASVRACAGWDCNEVGRLEPGAEITAAQIVDGRGANGNDKWIKFQFGPQARYVHGSALIESPLFDPTATEPPPPTATSTATEPPPPTSTATATATASATDSPSPTATATSTRVAKFVVETSGNRNALIRACPRRTCEIVDKYAPGTVVAVIGAARGETVYGTDIWLEISFEGGSAFLHSELAAEAG